MCNFSGRSALGGKGMHNTFFGPGTNGILMAGALFLMLMAIDVLDHFLRRLERFQLVIKSKAILSTMPSQR